MRTVSIQYTELALALREAINIAVSIFTLVLCGLIARYVVRELSDAGYRQVDWPVKLSVGLFFIFAGELLRSATIWEILHYEGSTGTYLSDVAPLLGSLLLIVLGALCVIRVMTPAKWGHSIWIGSLLLVIVLAALNAVL